MSKIAWVLLCLFIAQLIGCSSVGEPYDEGKLTKPGKLSGVVEDAKTHTPLSGVNVDVYKNGRKLVSKKTKPDGKYTLPLEAGKYTVKVSAEGRVAETMQVDVKSNETTTVARLRQVQVPKMQVKKGIAGGRVLDATNSRPIAQATLKVRKGIGSKSGKVLNLVSTGAFGRYSFQNLDAGNYTVEVNKTDHITTYFNLLVVNGTTLGRQNVALSPRVAKGALRIVLSWGDKPGDLDSHLVTPYIDDKRYHINYTRNGRDDPKAKTLLDVDRTNFRSSITRTVREGPETITIYQSRPGKYRYYIKNYSEAHLKGASVETLTRSRAKVDVYSNKGLLRTFNVPSEGKGIYWNVFNYNGSSGEITPVNVISD